MHQSTHLLRVTDYYYRSNLSLDLRLWSKYYQLASASMSALRVCPSTLRLRFWSYFTLRLYIDSGRRNRKYLGTKRPYFSECFVLHREYRKNSVILITNPWKIESLLPFGFLYRHHLWCVHLSSFAQFVISLFFGYMYKAFHENTWSRQVSH